MNDFMTCSVHFSVQSEGSIFSALGQSTRIKFSIYVHHTLMNTMSVCLSVCLSVCVHDNSKNNGSIDVKLEHTVVYENSSDEFDIGHCPIKVKVTA